MHQRATVCIKDFERNSSCISVFSVLITFPCSFWTKNFYTNFLSGRCRVWQMLVECFGLLLSNQKIVRSFRVLMSTNDRWWWIKICLVTGSCCVATSGSKTTRVHLMMSSTNLARLLQFCPSPLILKPVVWWFINKDTVSWFN